MLKDIEVTDNRVFEYICGSCNSIKVIYQLHKGIIPLVIKCKTCRGTMIKHNSNSKYASVLYYKPCKQRIDADAALKRDNNTLVAKDIMDTTSVDFLNACVTYAKEHYNPDSKLDSKFHPAIVLTWELLREEFNVSNDSTDITIKRK